MANEITYSVSLSASKGGASINSGTKSDTVDMTGNDVGTETASIGTTAGLIAAPGALSWGSGVRMLVQNQSGTPGELITIGKDNASPPTQVIAQLDAGEAFITRLVAQPYIYASATVQYQAWYCEV